MGAGDLSFGGVDLLSSARPRLCGLLRVRCRRIADLEREEFLSTDFAASSGSAGVKNSLDGLLVSTDSNTRGADTRIAKTHGKPIINCCEECAICNGLGLQARQSEK